MTLVAPIVVGFGWRWLSSTWSPGSSWRGWPA